MSELKVKVLEAPIFAGVAQDLVLKSNNVNRIVIANTGTISFGATAGSESLRVTPVASSVNYLQVAGSATGNAVQVVAAGSDTNIDLTLIPKGTGGVVFPAGAAGTPSVTTTGDTNTGIWFPAADTIAASTAGTERMRIDSSGNVGIGTSSPSGILDARGSVYLGNTSTGTVAVVRGAPNWNFAGLNVIRNAANTGSLRSIAMPLDGDNLASTTIGEYNAIWGAYDSSPTTNSTSSALNGAMVYGAYAGHRWVTNGTERMRIDSSGNVGIGTSSIVSPAIVDITKATTNNSIATQRQLRVGIDTSATYSLFIGYGQPVTGQELGGNIQSLDNGAGSKLLLNPSGGNVGIGTSSPSYQLTIQGTGQDTANLTDAGNKGASLFLRANAVASGSGGAVLFGTTFGNSTPFAAIKGLIADGTANTVGDIAFSTRNGTADTSLTERMRIASNGNVGIGTATTTYRTNIVYTNSAGGVAETGLYLRNTSTGNSTQMLFDGYRSWSLLVQGSFGGPAGGFTIQDNTAGVNRLSINDSGSVSINQAPGQYTIDTTNGATSIANGGTVNFSNASGMLLVNNHSTGHVTIYLCGAGLTGVVSSIGGQVGTFAYNAGIAGYTWTNNYGSSAIFGFVFFRTRATA